MESPAARHFNNAGRPAALVEWLQGNDAMDLHKMPQQNITVVVRKVWEVLIIRDDNQPHGELIDDEGFNSYAEALLHAARQADHYGVGITYGGSGVNGW